MPVYAIKNDETLAVRAFSCSEMAYDYTFKQQVFSTQDELYNTNLTDDQLKQVHYLITGFETRVQYRDYLCELIFNAIEAAGLPLTDVDADCDILFDPEPEPEPIELNRSSFEETAPGIIHSIPQTPTPNPEPSAADPDSAPINPEPPTVDIEPLIVCIETFPKEIEITVTDLETAIVESPTTDPDLKTINEEKNRPLPPRNGKMALSFYPKTKYSVREKLIFKTLVEAYPEPLTTKDIIEREFATYKKFHVQNAVSVATASLAKKTAYNNERFVVKTSKHSGPKPMTVWIEEREEP